MGNGIEKITMILYSKKIIFYKNIKKLFTNE